jgi:hypothetical protein
LVGVSETADIIKIAIQGKGASRCVELLRKRAIGDLGKRGHTTVLVCVI